MSEDKLEVWNGTTWVGVEWKYYKIDWSNPRPVSKPMSRERKAYLIFDALIAITFFLAAYHAMNIHHITFFVAYSFVMIIAILCFFIVLVE